MRDALQQIAGDARQVSTKSPNIGSSEALAHWDTVTAIVGTLLRARAELTRAGRDER